MKEYALAGPVFPWNGSHPTYDWLKDDSLDNLDDLPQREIIDHLEAALAAFRDVAAGLPSSKLAP
ncbi:hypothetical protein RD110_06675 [Rhodoferax koreense]|uniref:Uncharacterized protein n=1 Tax=Rhodoferax koreensis TaxID=1842727 RepID=A0A1P8JT19_9BURK|nr:hypothetical protein [Rhodoferax koreense]APW36914.1 hypothetical protein RD110_06675 [Rhodoferax koreense]